MKRKEKKPAPVLTPEYREIQENHKRRKLARKLREPDAAALEAAGQAIRQWLEGR